MDDRRWLVPKVREEKRSEGYWESFHNWLNFDFGLSEDKEVGGGIRRLCKDGARCALDLYQERDS
jgi:hypothetical protein